MKYLKYIFLLLVLAVATGYYMYNKPAKKTTSRNTDVTISAKQLYSDFEKNEADANKKGLRKSFFIVMFIH